MYDNVPNISYFDILLVFKKNNNPRLIYADFYVIILPPAPHTNFLKYHKKYCPSRWICLKVVAFDRS
jgi:hypothetical protein